MKRYPTFSRCQEEIESGERADYLPEFTRAVGGEVTQDKRRHAARAQFFGGSKGTRTQNCTVLQDTGSPSSFIHREVWQHVEMWISFSKWVNINAQKKMGRISRYTFDPKQQRTIEHSDGRGKMDNLREWERAQSVCLVVCICSRCTR